MKDLTFGFKIQFRVKEPRGKKSYILVYVYKSDLF